MYYIVFFCSQFFEDVGFEIVVGIGVVGILFYGEEGCVEIGEGLGIMGDGEMLWGGGFEMGYVGIFRFDGGKEEVLGGIVDYVDGWEVVDGEIEGDVEVWELVDEVGCVWIWVIYWYDDLRKYREKLIYY